MANKKYTLAAWTENGQVRMIPSLVNELSVPYREKIERLKGLWQEVENEVGWLLAQSRAHEEFARFLLRVGYPNEAYVEFENAAKVCLYCSDSLWLQGARGEFPTLPLYYRFLAMHRQCVLLTKESPVLKNCYVEPFAASMPALSYLQFQRIGYFNVDPTSVPEHLVFNKTVGLKDTWKK